jgi:carboxybiotin decarboxylase
MGMEMILLEALPKIELLETLKEFLLDSGYANLNYKQIIMVVVACALIYLAIGKKFEPLLLLPIAFGMLLVNLDPVGLWREPVKIIADGIETEQAGGLMYYVYHGLKWDLFPPLIFLGVGAMTDFGPLIANPSSILLGAGAQFGVFFTFICAILIGYPANEAASISIVGGADGPTAIFLTTKLAGPELLGPVAVAAYSYMALVPLIQPPIMKFLTTKEERKVRMGQLRKVKKIEKIIFPIAVTILIVLLIPEVAPLVGMLMLGNLFRESGVVERLSDTAQNALINIVTIFLGLAVGATAMSDRFLQPSTLGIIALGMVAFAISTAAGVLIAKLMYKVTKGKVNPLIGSAGVSAVPMAARVSQVVGQKEDPGNFLLMHAMGPNVAGVIGTAVAAGILLKLFS